MLIAYRYRLCRSTRFRRCCTHNKQWFCKFCFSQKQIENESDTYLFKWWYSYIYKHRFSISCNTQKQIHVENETKIYFIYVLISLDILVYCLKISAFDQNNGMSTRYFDFNIYFIVIPTKIIYELGRFKTNHSLFFFMIWKPKYYGILLKSLKKKKFTNPLKFLNAHPKHFKAWGFRSYVKDYMTNTELKK